METWMICSPLCAKVGLATRLKVEATSATLERAPEQEPVVAHRMVVARVLQAHTGTEPDLPLPQF